MSVDAPVAEPVPAPTAEVHMPKVYGEPLPALPRDL
jgi:hypothetical protein